MKHPQLEVYCWMDFFVVMHAVPFFILHHFVTTPRHLQVKLESPLTR
jgi:hypothetical protein